MSNWFLLFSSSELLIILLYIIFVQQIHSIYLQYLFLKGLLHVSMFVHQSSLGSLLYMLNLQISKIETVMREVVTKN
jgi:hypothetical protein